MNKNLVFHECPRPQLVRESWVNLDGDWDFLFDETGGVWPNRTGYENGFKKQYTIKVPYAYQCEMSGIGIIKKYSSVWYQRRITINKIPNHRNILHLEGADYCARIYLNGQYVDCDSGPYHRMSFDLTDFAIDGENLLIINCLDDSSQEKPRGKQRWTDKPFECWYIETTGLYKSVWLETVPNTRVESLVVKTNRLDRSINLSLKLLGYLTDAKMKITVKFENKVLAVNEFSDLAKQTEVKITLDDEPCLWGINKGNLYDINVELKSLNNVDKISTYTAFRDIKIENGEVLLNDKPLYQKLVLDQGYWSQSHLTAPSLFDLYNDINKMIQLGFNGARKHEKIDDERFYYYADKLGFLVWCEMPSMYRQTPDSKLIFEREWKNILQQYVNHPCIITWVIFNESWGCEHISNNRSEIEFSIRMYDLTKEYDVTRIIIANDGWEHTVCDLLSIHYYEQDGLALFDALNNKEDIVKNWSFHEKSPFANGFSYNKQPILLTEFGGSALKKNTENSNKWGYGNSCDDLDSFVKRIELLFQMIQKIDFLQGYCYTQLTDVQTEVNGLLDENHNFKLDPNIIKNIQNKR